MNGMVYFIGAGPGDPDLLTLKGRRIIDSADVIVYAGSLVNPDLLDGARPEAAVHDSSALNLQQITGIMIEAARRGKIVARLHTGDPSLYGAIAEQISVLREAGVNCAVVPGVSSVFAAAAALQLEFTRPGQTQTLILTRRAGRTPVPEAESLSALAAHGSAMAIFLSAGMLEQSIDDLLAGGYRPETPAAVVYRASWDDELCLVGTLDSIASRAREAGIERQALILVGDAVGGSVAEPSRLYAPEFSHAFRVVQGSRREGMAVVALTRRGRHTGMRILNAFEQAELYLPMRFQSGDRGGRISFYEELGPLLVRLFTTHAQLVLIMATGIAVRMLAPHLGSKWEDPAVVTLDDSGRTVISLLAGHWGGANTLTDAVARILGGTPVVTTESDVMGFPAVDMLVRHLTGAVLPEDPDLLKRIQTAILDGDPVGFFPRDLEAARNMQGHAHLHFYDSIDDLAAGDCAAGLIVCPQQVVPPDFGADIAIVHPRNLTVGIGCHRGVTASDIEQGVRKVFADHSLALESIAAICTVEHKCFEDGLIGYAMNMGVPLECFSAAQINTVTIASPSSEAAFEALGVQGVAEPAALLGSSGGSLLVPKVKLAAMTIAVAARPVRQILMDSGVDSDVC